MKKIIPVFYATDDAFVKFTIVSLKSMIENASKDYEYHVHILNTNISETMKNKLMEFENDCFKIEFNDVTSYIDFISDRMPLRDYYSKTTYFRLFIAEMFNEYDKAIYIDSDTIVLGDISNFYNHELGTNILGACNEQAMVQEDVYGTYVEEVLGCDRNKYFNAGVLLINLKEFRKQQILEEFIKLLYIYNFVVTQDEDYLNLTCKGKVTWIENSWNTEVFGEIKYKDEEINIIHYIMVAKPWHYENVRLQDHFWKYAKMTSVYDAILDELHSFTDEKKQKDAISAERLKQLAIDETARPDNYFKMLKKNERR